VIRVGHWLFLAGTAFVALGIIAAVFLVSDVVYGWGAAAATSGAVGLCMLVSWYLMPLVRGRSGRVRTEE
jgi:hypothetical protein